LNKEGERERERERERGEVSSALKGGKNPKLGRHCSVYLISLLFVLNCI